MAAPGIARMTPGTDPLPAVRSAIALASPQWTADANPAVLDGSAPGPPEGRESGLRVAASVAARHADRSQIRRWQAMKRRRCDAGFSTALSTSAPVSAARSSRRSFPAPHSTSAAPAMS